MANCFHSGNASQLTCARRPTWPMTQVHISPPMRKTPDTADWRALIASFISEPLDTGSAGSIYQCEEENERFNEGAQMKAVRERDPHTIASDSVSIRAH